MLSNLKSLEENKKYLKSVIGENKRGYIAFKNSIGKEIEYEYDWKGEYFKGILKIVKYVTKKQKVYFEGHEKGIFTGHLIECKLGGILNIIWNKARWMVDLGVSVEDAKKYTIGSHENIEVKCPNCGKVKKTTPAIIYRTHSIGCSCGDGVSYPEKLMEGVLIQLGTKYERQYRPNWSQNKAYDFYLLGNNTIIETHGRQHYEESVRKRSLKEEQENDKLKEELAFKNGIKYYVVIDCKESELEYIKNNILNSELNELFDLSKIDWSKCEEYALKNKVKEVCNYYNEHPEMFIVDLVKKFGISRDSIVRYLKSGVKLGWCQYDAKESKRRIGERNSKAVSQFTLEGEFIGAYSSAVEAERHTGVNNSGISRCCNGKSKTAGGFIWRYTQ